MSRGNRKQPIFLSAGDHVLFLALAKSVVERRRWIVHGYCLMPNHYHLLVQTPQADLSGGMQEINGGYAQWFNRLHGFVGHVFQGRFKAIPVETDGHLLELTRYIARNPIRAGLCASALAWRWSSFRDVVEHYPTPFPSCLKMLGFFDPDEDLARDVFRRFVED